MPSTSCGSGGGECDSGLGECQSGGENCHSDRGDCDSGRRDCNSACGEACSSGNPLKSKGGQSRVCIKCKIGSSLGDQSEEALCKDCLHASLLAKFKTAIHGLVSPTERVLVAVSGGSASRVALELFKEIRSKAQSDANASKDRVLNVFGLGAVFVNEVTFVGAREGVGMKDLIGNWNEDGIPLHVVQLQSLFDNDEEEFSVESGLANSSDSNGKQGEKISQSVEDLTGKQGDKSQMLTQSVEKFSGKTGEKPEHLSQSLDKPGEKPELLSQPLEDLTGKQGEKLKQLFQSVDDVTGKQDLVEYLRLQAIQKVAEEHGYTKVVLGLCTTRIAARVIAATTKGRGFSLPADIQFLDMRRPVPVLLPLRDCVARELALFCQTSNWKTDSVKGSTALGGPCRSLNDLAESFITVLLDENPSREHSIVRTAAKLKSFKFNESDQPGSRRRRNPQTSDSTAYSDPDILCPICCAPVERNDVLAVGNISSSAEKDDSIPQQSSELKVGERAEVNGSLFRATCCPSCKFQICPEKATEKYELLPKAMKERGFVNFARQQSWMRGQIESYLLPEE